MRADNLLTEHRVVVITGGAGDLGRAISRRLAADGAIGALWDIDARRAVEAAAVVGPEWIGLEADLTSPDEAQRAAEQTLARFGRVDVLVTAAGITGPSVPSAEYDPATFDRVVATNLHAVFYSTRALLGALTESANGRIVNISSVAGKEGNPNLCAYSAAKAGVIALTKTLGKELALTNVRVNAVTPAMLNGSLLSQMTPEYVAAGRAKIPLGRFGEPEEVAELVAWLASPQCSFSTAAVFDASGGRATY